MSTLGYKQTIFHTNDLPIIKTKIVDLSSICEYVNEKEENFTKNKYSFNVVVQGGGLLNACKHVYYFDNENQAENYHKELRIMYYDQQVKPILNKIKSKNFLTCKDKEKIYSIFNKMDKIKEIEKVTIK